MNQTLENLIKLRSMGARNSIPGMGNGVVRKMKDKDGLSVTNRAKVEVMKNRLTYGGGDEDPLFG